MRPSRKLTPVKMNAYDRVIHTLCRAIWRRRMATNAIAVEPRVPTASSANASPVSRPVYVVGASSRPPTLVARTAMT